jgi:hypothetical protein
VSNVLIICGGDFQGDQVGGAAEEEGGGDNATGGGDGEAAGEVRREEKCDQEKEGERER